MTFEEALNHLVWGKLDCLEDPDKGEELREACRFALYKRIARRNKPERLKICHRCGTDNSITIDRIGCPAAHAVVYCWNCGQAILWGEHEEVEEDMEPRIFAQKFKVPGLKAQICGKKFRHFKGGIYRVVGVGVHSETAECMVIYRSCGDGYLWVRPAEMFLSEVDHEKYPDVTQKMRFEPIEGEEE